MAESSSTQIQINIKGPSELKLQINIETDKTVLELKQAIADKSDVPADRQRLIYSGRVLKDDDVLSVYKIQTSHTIHMVKGAARSGASASGSGSGVSSTTPAAPQVPNMRAGMNPSDPLTLLNGPMGHGLLAGFNPYADMGVNPNDPNFMQTLMSSPEYMQQMSALMSNPAVIDQIIALNPQLQSMGPMMRQMMQSEQFRQMLSNPEAIRSMMQTMSNSPGAFPGFPGAAGGGGGGFPAPGLPSYSQQQPSQAPASPTSGSGTGAAAGTLPGSPPAGGFPAFPNFAGMFPPAQPGAATGTPGAGGAAGAGATPNPYPWGMVDPGLMQSLMGGMGGMGGFPPFGGAGAGGVAGATPATPADTRAPEERFQTQLQQLNEMGFTNASQNIRALLATGGNVHSAIEYILSGGGL